MKKVVVRECGDVVVDNIYELDLREKNLKDCMGCWNCWIKIPGKCIHKDLDRFYEMYLEADTVVFFVNVKKGFVSGNIKTLFDRLIPHFLPYMDLSGDCFNHAPRYQKYPNIEFYYSGEFLVEGGEEVFRNYIQRTFTQFRSQNILIKKIV